MDISSPKEETAFDALREGRIEDSILLWKRVQEESGHCNTDLCHNTDHEQTCCVNHLHGRLLTLSLRYKGSDHFELAKLLAVWIRDRETGSDQPEPQERPQFELSDSLIIGHPTIDHDHRVLAKFINDVSTTLWEKDYGKSRLQIYDFLKHMRRHFEKELLILEHIDFPEVEEHARAHERLKQRTRELQEMADQLETSEIDRERVFPEMVSFFLDDAIKIDLEIKAFLDLHGQHFR